MTVYAAKSCDRVWERDAVTGTGTINLGGSAPAGGYRTFAQATAAGQLATGALARYCIHDTVTDAWEVGLGTYTSGSPGTLSRTIVFQSTNANALVSFAGNSCDVFITENASRVDWGMLPFVAGNWYSAPGSSDGAAVSAATTLSAHPFRWRGPAKPAALAIQCTTAPSATTAFELGIYDGTSGTPGALLLDAGAASIASSFSAPGVVTVTISSPPVIDVPNVFLTVGTPSAGNGAQLAALGGGYNNADWLLAESLGSSQGAAMINFGYEAAYAGGALPATFPSSAMSQNIPIFRVWVQF
ncbi:MAG: hypothetical protein ACREFO_00980 [Acetobacteraceae bacterium]